MKIKILLVSVYTILCGNLYSQIYTPEVPTSYGRKENRIKVVSHLGIPYGTTASLNGGLIDPGAIYYQTSDSSLYSWTGTQWLKIGSGGSGSDKIDTVQTYKGLRDYSGTAKTLILTDSLRGGTFYYTGESENGATVIDGWRRIFDGIHYKPEWFEIGGKDMNGASYNRLTGAGIGSWAKAIAQTCLLAGKGAVIEYNKSFEYPIDRLIPIKQEQVHRGGKLKRATPVWTLISNNESIGSTTIEVADASNLQAGMTFLIKGAGTDGSHNDNSNGTTGTEYHEIISISSNTLTISGSVYPIAKAMLAGDTLITVSPMLYRENSILGASDSDYIVICRDMTFDGNYEENNHFIDYQQPATIEMFGGYIIADNCTFKNIPGENIYTTGGNITNCFAHKLQGSFAHGTNNLNTLDSLYQEFVVVNLKADSVGLGQAELQGHSETILWVNSTKTANAKFVNCTVTNSGRVGRGKPLFNGNQDDGIVQVFGGVYTNARAIIDLSGQDSSTAKKSRIIIKDAVFDNCGWGQITGVDVRRGNGLKDVLIDNNKFYNSRWYFDQIAGLQFTNNKMYVDSTTYVKWDDSRASGTGTSSWFFGTGQQSLFMVTAYMDRLTITGNTFDRGFKNDSIMTCLMITLSDSVYRKNGTQMTDYYYGQDYNISNNTISNFRYALQWNISTFAKQLVNCRLDNNTIDLSSHSDYASDYVYGLQVPPGATALNPVVTGYHASNYSFPIMVYGVKSTGNYSKIVGGTVDGAKIFGPSNYAIRCDPFNQSPYNITLLNCTSYKGAIHWNTDANTYKLGDINNNVLSNSTLTNYQPHFKAGIGDNKTNY